MNLEDENKEIEQLKELAEKHKYILIEPEENDFYEICRNTSLERLLDDIISNASVEYVSGHNSGTMDSYKCSLCGSSEHTRNFEVKPSISDISHSYNCTYIRTKKILSEIEE